MHSLRVQAKLVVVSAKEILQPGQIVIRQGRIVEVVAGQPLTPDVDLGDTVLIPGLVNAHTHLEFSDLKQPLPAGEHFPQWISQVVAYRRQRPEAGLSPLSIERAGQDVEQGVNGPLENAIESGLHEAFCSGTALLGDIVTQPWQRGTLPSSNRFYESVFGSQTLQVPAEWLSHLRPLCFPRIVAFAEVIGLSTKRLQDSWRWAEALVQTSGKDSHIPTCSVSEGTQAENEMLLALGVSPHAPYSLHFPSALEALAQLPDDCLLAMHIAESLDELQWLEHGDGAFGEAYQRLGLSVEVPPPTVDECIALLSSRRRGLLIHGNYLTTKQIGQVARAPGISVVFCPSTHRHFGHTPYPLTALQAAGIPLLLATDSRASNPTLSLWDEVSCARSAHPDVPPKFWLNAVTLAPARALGQAEHFGTLHVGKWASAVALPARRNWTSDNLLAELCGHTAEELSMHPLVSRILSNGIKCF